MMVSVGITTFTDPRDQMPPGQAENMPIGMLVARIGKALDRAFDEALAAAGGTRPAWLILLAVK